MVALTAALFKAIVNDAAISATNAEYIIDYAIGKINNYSNAGLPLMGGTAGSKTVSLEDRKYAAVMDAARAIYYGAYKKVKGASIGGFTLTPADLLSNPTVVESIKEAARQLAEFDVGYG